MLGVAGFTVHHVHEHIAFTVVLLDAAERKEHEPFRFMGSVMQTGPVEDWAPLLVDYAVTSTHTVRTHDTTTMTTKIHAENCSII